MDNASLKSHLVRLAHDVPELRLTLIPLLTGKQASGTNLLGQLIRLASADPLLQEHVQHIITAKAKAKKFQNEQHAKRYFLRYRRKHPKTKKTWKDFYEAPEKSPKEVEHHDGDSLPAVLKKAPKEVAQAVAKAPNKLKQFITDPKARKEQMRAVADKIKKSPKATVKSIKTALKKEKEEITGGLVAIGKVMRGKKLSKHDKKAMYAVGVYAAMATVGGLTGGMAGVGGAVLHSFQYHIGFKAVAVAADELFTHYESGYAVSELFNMVSSEDEPGDEAKIQALAEVMTVAVSKALENGLSDEEMSKILQGEKPPGMGELKGLAS